MEAPGHARDLWTGGRHPIRFETKWIPPTEGEAVNDLELSDPEHEDLFDHVNDLYGQAASHQIGGFPAAVQNADMEADCELRASALDASKPEDRALAEARASEWRLLLQIDSDDELDYMWGDVGMLYFWVRANDAKRGHFEDVWMEFQCH